MTDEKNTSAASELKEAMDKLYSQGRSAQDITDMFNTYVQTLEQDHAKQKAKDRLIKNLATDIYTYGTRMAAWDAEKGGIIATYSDELAKATAQAVDEFVEPEAIKAFNLHKTAESDVFKMLNDLVDSLLTDDKDK